MAQSFVTNYFKRSPGSLTAAAPPAKRAKSTAESSVSDVSTASPPQSPASQDDPATGASRAEQNRLAALAKRQSNGPANLGSTWKRALCAEFTKPYYQKLQSFLTEERKSHTIYPPEADVFSWSTLCRADEIKVVIIGQDPYHGPNQAHGLCFSVRKGVALPPSLVNIYKELDRSVESFTPPGHGDLSTWAQQGVLLLNNVLTVRAHSANSHQGKGWESFTDAVITWLNKNHSGVVFLLWGRNAQSKCKSIDKRKHHILTAVHPSPLSAHRGFIGCNHFVQANDLLRKQGKSPIEWASVCKGSWTPNAGISGSISPKSSQSSESESQATPLTPVSQKPGGLAASASPTTLFDPTQDW